LIHDDEPVGWSPLQGDGPHPVPGQHCTAWSKIYEDSVGPYSCGNPNDLRGRGEGRDEGVRGGQILEYFQYIAQQIIKDHTSDLESKIDMRNALSGSRLVRIWKVGTPSDFKGTFSKKLSSGLILYFPRGFYGKV
jgi:hypothetical protein